MSKSSFTQEQRAKFWLFAWQFIATQACLILLKLAPHSIGYTWSWWWVLLPIWVPTLVLAVWFAFYFLGMLMMVWLDQPNDQDSYQN
jgi:hypothetical protein